MAQLMYSSVKAAIRRKDGRMLFFKDDVAGFPKGLLDLPGGRLNKGEDPYEALGREVFEETRLAVKVGKPLGMYYFMRSDGDQITLTVFECACEDLSALDLGGNSDPTEHLSEPQWLLPSEAAARKDELVHESFARLLLKL